MRLVPGGKFGPEMSHFFIFPKPPPFDLTMVREMLTNHISSEHFSRTARPKGGDLEKMKKCDISGPNVPPGTTPKRGGSCDQYNQLEISTREKQRTVFESPTQLYSLFLFCSLVKPAGANHRGHLGGACTRAVRSPGISALRASPPAGPQAPRRATSGQTRAHEPKRVPTRSASTREQKTPLLPWPMQLISASPSARAERRHP